MGAEFVKDSKVHTAGATSIRFPRILKIRDDKNWDDATTLAELVELASQTGGKKKGGASSKATPSEKSTTSKKTTTTKKSKKNVSFDIVLINYSLLFRILERQ